MIINRILIKFVFIDYYNVKTQKNLYTKLMKNFAKSVENLSVKH